MKRKMMKMVTVILSLVLVFTLFAGCGGDSSSASGPVRDDGSIVIRVPFASEAIVTRPWLWQQLRQHRP